MSAPTALTAATALTARTFGHEPVVRSELWDAWHAEPLMVGGLALVAVLYAHGLSQPRARPPGRAVPARPAARPVHVASFAGGLVALAVALASPLDAAAASLFSAHMVQHLVLLVVAAPLLACGRPVAVLTRALPRRGRRLLARARARRPVRRFAEAAVDPGVAWVLGTAALWVWHLPGPYEAALRNDLLHAVEHATLLGTAALTWALALGRAHRPLAVPVAAGLLFATSLQSGALGAVLALARTPLYPVHAAVTPSWGLTPLEDQQLAGGLMWVPPGLVYLVVIAVLVVRWFGSLGSPESLGAAAPATTDRATAATTGRGSA